VFAFGRPGGCNCGCICCGGGTEGVERVGAGVIGRRFIVGSGVFVGVGGLAGSCFGGRCGTAGASSWLLEEEDPDNVNASNAIKRDDFSS
jgi:hypothetical protein